jgi:hypothetical protein
VIIGQLSFSFARNFSFFFRPLSIEPSSVRDFISGQVPDDAVIDLCAQFFSSEPEEIGHLELEPICGFQALNLFGELVSRPVDGGKGFVHGGLAKIRISHGAPPLGALGLGSRPC